MNPWPVSLPCVTAALAALAPLLAAPDWTASALLWALVVGEFLVCGLPALLWAALGHQKWAEAFSWRRPRPAALAGAVLMGLGLIPPVDALVVLQNRLYHPFVRSGLEQTRTMLPVMQAHPLLSALGLSLTAAVCEEMLFRGVIQRALLRRLPAWAALGLGGLLFAAFHFDAQGLAARTALGVLLGWLVLRSGSIFPAMAMHFVYDAALLGVGAWQLRSLGAGRVLALAAQPSGGVVTADLIVWTVLGLALLAAGAWLCRRSFRPAPLQGGAPSPTEAVNDPQAAPAAEP